jgi:hypothetical protein
MAKFIDRSMKIILITIFSIAMGLLEAIVVVYLRMFFYPQGFQFPLKPITLTVFGIELLREIATLVMLGSLSSLTGKNHYQRLAYFLSSFGIWDIFYYIWLKVLINWPVTLLDWDILFLIPITWVGPVLAPIIFSLVLLIISGLILSIDQSGQPIKFRRMEWLLFLVGSLIIFYTFTRNFILLIINRGYLRELSTLGTNVEFQKAIMLYKPNYFSWDWFAVGIGIILYSTFIFAKRYIRR